LRRLLVGEQRALAEPERPLLLLILLLWPEHRYVMLRLQSLPHRVDGAQLSNDDKNTLQACMCVT
jgi:hypothetical protein